MHTKRDVTRVGRADGRAGQAATAGRGYTRLCARATRPGAEKGRTLCSRAPPAAPPTWGLRHSPPPPTSAQHAGARAVRAPAKKLRGAGAGGRVRPRAAAPSAARAALQGGRSSLAACWPRRQGSICVPVQMTAAPLSGPPSNAGTQPRTKPTHPLPGCPTHQPTHKQPRTSHPHTKHTPHTRKRERERQREREREIERDAGGAGSSPAPRPADALLLTALGMGHTAAPAGRPAGGASAAAVAAHVSDRHPARCPLIRRAAGLLGTRPWARGTAAPPYPPGTC